MTIRPSAMATGIVDWAARAPDRAAVVDVHRTLTVGELDAAAAALAARLLDGAGPQGCRWVVVAPDRGGPLRLDGRGHPRCGPRRLRVRCASSRRCRASWWRSCSRASGTRTGRSSPIREYAELLPDGVDVVLPFGHEGVGAAAPQAVDHDAPGHVQFTSGSTGRPKGVVIPWSSLDEVVQSAMGVGPSSGVDQWTEGFVQQFGAGVAVPCGRPAERGRTPCIADPTTMSIDDLLDWFDAQPGRLGLVRSVVVARNRPSRRRSATSALGVTLPVELGSDSLVARRAAASTRRAAPHDSSRVCRVRGRPDRALRHRTRRPDRRGSHPPRPPGTGRGSAAGAARRRPRRRPSCWSRGLVTFGYLDDPELTASRYVTDDDGTRWWRSADIVRVDDAGMYHHVGRADEMVKVKGAFVAPSRVEAGAAEHRRNRRRRGDAAPAANDSVRVVAHVQVVDDTLTPERVDAQLRERLPRDLVPAILVRHDELPRTQRMKLDRQALEQRAARAVAVDAGCACSRPSSSGGVSPRCAASSGSTTSGPTTTSSKPVWTPSARSSSARRSPTPASVTSIRLGSSRRAPSPASSGCSGRRVTPITQPS